MKRLFTGVATQLLFAALVQAVPITYTIQGTATGSLGALAAGVKKPDGLLFNPFTSAAFTITLSTDTTQVSGGTTPAVSTSFNITGVGSGTFTNPLQLQVQTGTQTVALLGVMSFTNPAFGSFNLTSALGPLGVTPVLLPSNVPTSRGALTFTSASNVTFTSAPAGPPPIPAPPTLLLGLTGLGCALALYMFRATTHPRSRASGA